MPSAAEVVTAVCRLPIDFRRGNVSATALVRRSGYLAARHEVTVDRLADCLATDPDLVGAWLTWSEDNRSTPAWYIEALGTGGFEVGYYDHGRTSQVAFDDRIRACAEYLFRYLEQFA